MNFILSSFLFLSVVIVICGANCVEPIDKKPKCREDQVFNSCGSVCDNVCPSDDPILCNAACKPGCYCPKAMIDKDGVCEPKDKVCGKPQQCSGGKVFTECGSACANECPGSHRVCTAVCIPGCFCPVGSIDVNGECVPRDDHCKKQLECTGGKVYNECGNPCNDLCPESGRFCTLQCTAGCYCPEGMVNKDGTCVPEAEAC